MTRHHDQSHLQKEVFNLVLMVLEGESPPSIMLGHSAGRQAWLALEPHWRAYALFHSCEAGRESQLIGNGTGF